jgi:UbiD family decarboxylase
MLSSAVNRPPQDLREHLSNLEKLRLLHHVKTEVDKDWELSCIARQIYMQLPEHQRYALMFDNVKGYHIPVAVGAIAASKIIYATGLGTTPDNIQRRWVKALSSPIEPSIVRDGPVRENVLVEEEVDLGKFPIPIWTPTKDAGPYLTAPYIVTRDPNSAYLNVATARNQVIGKNKTLINIIIGSHTGNIFAKYRETKKPMPTAIVLGAEPVVGMTSTAKVPEGVSEYSVAGGLKGSPLELIKCETSDLLVPANAEIVLEGEVSTDEKAREGPFGENRGYMSRARDAPVFKIKRINHRNNPIYLSFISQTPPSESMTIQGAALESLVYKLLAVDLGFAIRDVAMRGETSLHHLAVSFKKGYPGQPYRILLAAMSVSPNYNKVAIAVDDDVDVQNWLEVERAVQLRARPDKDYLIVPNMHSTPNDPSNAPPGATPEEMLTGSKLFIDATKKWPYPDTSLPPQEMLDRVKAKWKTYGLPPLPE